MWHRYQQTFDSYSQDVTYDLEWLSLRLNFKASFVVSNPRNSYVSTGTNVVSETSEFLPLEPPVRVTGGGRSSLRRNLIKCSTIHIFKVRNLSGGLK